MLGNFSFGDYFKDQASPGAFEIMTEVFKIDVDRLFASVLEGDQEAIDIWTQKVGLAPDRVIEFPKEDNFWQMGVAGPCGPCSEIYVDRGTEFGPDGRPTRADEEANER